MNQHKDTKYNNHSNLNAILQNIREISIASSSSSLLKPQQPEIINKNHVKNKMIMPHLSYTSSLITSTATKDTNTNDDDLIILKKKLEIQKLYQISIHFPMDLQDRESLIDYLSSSSTSFPTSSSSPSFTTILSCLIIHPFHFHSVVQANPHVAVHLLRNLYNHHYLHFNPLNHQTTTNTTSTFETHHINPNFMEDTVTSDDVQASRYINNDPSSTSNVDDADDFRNLIYHANCYPCLIHSISNLKITLNSIEFIHLALTTFSSECLLNQSISNAKYSDNIRKNENTLTNHLTQLVPSETTRNFISRSIHACSLLDLGSHQRSRLSRILSMFFMSLLKRNLFDLDSYYLDIQSFCIENSKTKEAVELLTFIKKQNQGFPYYYL